MSEAYTVLSSVFGLAFLWFFVTIFWRDYRLDALREHVFCIRDNLFLFAAQGNVNFDEPAYRILRDRMNTAIRFAHVFTVPRIVLAATLRDQTDNTEFEKFSEAVGRITSADTRRQLEKFNRVLVIAIMKHIVYRSFALYLIFRPVAFFSDSSDEAIESWRFAQPLIPKVDRIESKAIARAKWDERFGRRLVAA
jgi:hypothetical protein